MFLLDVQTSLQELTCWDARWAQVRDFSVTKCFDLIAYVPVSF